MSYSNIQSTNKNPYNVIDPLKVGTGSNFKKGNFFRAKKYGLKGQLSKFKDRFRKTAAANISSKNLRQIYDLISDRLKNKPPGL